MKRTMIAHIGLPKAASTTIQKHFFPDHPEIEFLGLPFKSAVFEEIRNRMVYMDGLSYDIKKEYEKFTTELNRIPSEKKIFVWSDEALSWTRGADRILMCDRVKDVVGAQKIIMIIREQISSIYSHHAMDAFKSYETLKEKGNINAWIEAAQPFKNRGFHHLLYFSLIDLYVDKFGRENVGVFFFEDLQTNPRNFYSAISKFMGLTHSVKDLGSRNPSENVRRASRRIQQWAKLKNRYFPSLKLTRVMPGPMREVALRFMESGQRANIVIDEERMEILREFFAENNRKLQDKFGLPLSEKGYVV